MKVILFIVAIALGAVAALRIESAEFYSPDLIGMSILMMIGAAAVAALGMFMSAKDQARRWVNIFAITAIALLIAILYYAANG
jgi:hypothetical protein